MKRFISVLCLLASFTASSGELALGRIVATTTVNNATTAAPFFIQPGAKLTIQCDTAAYVCTDVATCTTTTGVKIAADAIFPTSVGVQKKIAIGGLTTSSVISVVAVAGTANCTLFERNGRE